MSELNEEKIPSIQQEQDKINAVCERLKLILQMRMKYLSFDEVYGRVYDIILNRRAGELHQAVYNLLKNYLQTVILPIVISGISSENVAVLLEAWVNHQRSLKNFHAILEHLENPTMVDLNLIGINEMGVLVFKEYIINDGKISEKLRNFLIRELHLKQVQSHSDVRNSLDLLITTDLYNNVFEEDYLKTLEAYHKKVVEDLLKRGSIIEYLTSFEETYKKQDHISTNYLRCTTYKRALKILEDTYIKLHLEEIIRLPIGLSHLLNEYNYVKILNDIYKLFVRFGDINNLIDVIEEIFCEKGNSFIEKNRQMDKFKAIEELVELRARFIYFIKEAFEDNNIIHARIQKNVESMLNNKGVVAEYLADYFHMILKRKQKMLDDEFDNKILGAQNLFLLLRDKDSFEKFYRYYFSIRILSNKYQREAEEEVLTNFKNECGLTYTNKMHSMLKDIDLSGSHMEFFHRFLSSDEYQPPNFDFSIFVLQSNNWNITESPICNLPPGPSSIFALYLQFFKKEHNNRKLILQANAGTAILKGHFKKPNGSDITYEFEMSTYQMTILMLFNKYTRLNLNEIQKETEIPMKELQSTLAAMTLGKSPCGILICNENKNHCLEERIYEINKNFNGKKFRKIKVPSAKSYRATKEDEIKSVWDEADKSRIDTTKATIVRVMKARKKLMENDLIAEVITILQKYFHPEVQYIKNIIQSLVEKDFIEVDPSNAKMYKYLA